MDDKFYVMFHSRYWDLSFFEHARHIDFIEQFNMFAKDLDPKKLYQICMDKPKVNVKLLNCTMKSLKVEKRLCSILLSILVAVVFMKSVTV